MHEQQRERHLAVDIGQTRVEHACRHAEQNRHERIQHEEKGIDADADADGAIVAGAVDLLKETRRDHEIRPQHGEVDPAGRPVAPRIPHPGFRNRGMQPVEAADRREDEGQRDGEARQLHRQLHDVDDSGRFQTSGGEVRRDHQGAKGAAGNLGDADHDGEDPRDAHQLAGEDADRTDPEERRHGRAHAPVVAPFEKVADRPQVVLGREPPDARSDAQRQNQRPEAGGADPPHRGDAVAVAQPGRADRGAAADVRCQEGRKQQSWAECPAGHEKVARSLQPPGYPEPERDLRDRVGDDDGEIGHGAIRT